MPQSNEAMREGFEVHAMALGFNRTRCGYSYESTETHKAWCDWQAACAWQRERDAGIIENMTDGRDQVELAAAIRGQG